MPQATTCVRPGLSQGSTRASNAGSKPLAPASRPLMPCSLRASASTAPSASIAQALSVEVPQSTAIQSAFVMAVSFPSAVE